MKSDLDPIPLSDDASPPPATSRRPNEWDVIIEESPPENPVVQRRSFGSDLAYSLVLFIEPSNLLSLGVLWFFNLLAASQLWLALSGSAIGLVSLFCCGLLYAWLFAYYMRLVLEIADNQDDLPDTMIGDVWEAVVRPFFTFVMTWFCLMLPAIIMISLRTKWNLNVPLVWIWAAVFLAFFMWPMALLGVSIGGVSVFVRADLMLYTVLRTFFPYLIVWALLLIMFGVGYWLIKFVSSGGAAAATPIWAKHGLAGAALISLFVTYTSIVAMRVIGLYYRHFKHRFAWSWE